MKNYMNKIKNNLPEMRNFNNRYLREILTISALVAAGFSSWNGFFINGLGMSLLFTSIGLLVGIIFPTQVHNVIHKFYELTSRRSNTAQIGIECAKIVGAFCVSFVYFAGVGLLASNSYRHFSNQARGNRDHDMAA